MAERPATGSPMRPAGSCYAAVFFWCVIGLTGLAVAAAESSAASLPLGAAIVLIALVMIWFEMTFVDLEDGDLRVRRLLRSQTYARKDVLSWTWKPAGAASQFLRPVVVLRSGRTVKLSSLRATPESERIRLVTAYLAEGGLGDPQ